MQFIRINDLISRIEEIIKTPIVIEEKNEERKKELEKVFSIEQDLKDLAAQGSPEARQYLKNKIYRIITNIPEINENSITYIIKDYHIDYFQNIYIGEEKNLRDTYKIDEEIIEYFTRFSINEYTGFEQKKLKLAQIVYQELFGYSVIDELVFEGRFDEIGCNDFNYIYVQFRGVKRHIPNKQFKFKTRYFYDRLVADRICLSSKVELNYENPVLYAKLLNGARITAAKPHLAESVVVSIRLHNYKELSESQRNSFMPKKFFRLINLLNGKGKRSICIIGEMGSGKTTIAKIIIQEMDKHTAIGVAENVHELELRNNYPEKNVISLQYFGENFTPSQITEMFFRLNRDVLIYGEIRGHEEAYEVIKALLRLAKGSLFTFHTSTVTRLIHDIRQLLMQTGHYHSHKEARFDVADAVDLVIHVDVDKKTGIRKVHKISEIYTNLDLSYNIRDLIMYNKSNGKFKINKFGVSEKVLKDCYENYNLTLEDIEEIKEIFKIQADEENELEYFEDEGIHIND